MTGEDWALRGDLATAAGNHGVALACYEQALDKMANMKEGYAKRWEELDGESLKRQAGEQWAAFGRTLGKASASRYALGEYDESLTGWQRFMSFKSFDRLFDKTKLAAGLVAGCAQGLYKGTACLGKRVGQVCAWCWDECTEHQGQRVVAAWKACAEYCREHSLEEMAAQASVKGCQIGGGIAKQATHWLEELHAAEDPFEQGRKVGELIGEIGAPIAVARGVSAGMKLASGARGAAAGARGASALASEGEALFSHAFKETAKLEGQLVPRAVFACEEGAVSALACEEGGVAALAKRCSLFSEMPLETEVACDMSRKLTFPLKETSLHTGHAPRNPLSLTHQKKGYIKQVQKELKPLMSQGKTMKPVSEERLRGVLAESKVYLPPRPKGIPANCVTKLTDRNCGIKYVTAATANLAEEQQVYVRIMPRMVDAQPFQQHEYMSFHIRNQRCDRYGNVRERPIRPQEPKPQKGKPLTQDQKNAYKEIEKAYEAADREWAKAVHCPVQELTPEMQKIFMESS
ncbi:MAG: hypothetical protein VXZ72_01375 [Chlamydiota bacterium]|nr:hypothetical protein [Chlamydiota bacterium]